MDFKINLEVQTWPHKSDAIARVAQKKENIPWGQPRAARADDMNS